MLKACIDCEDDNCEDCEQTGDNEAKLKPKSHGIGKLRFKLPLKPSKCPLFSRLPVNKAN